MSTTSRTLRGSVVIVALALVGAYAGQAFAVEEGDPVPGEPGAVRRPYIPYEPGKFASRAQGAPDHPVNVNITQIELNEFPQIKVYVQLTDASGLPIPDQPAGAFSLTEQSSDEEAPTVQALSLGEVDSDTGSSVVLVIDRSGSMEWEYEGVPGIDAAKSAAITFVNAMGPNDRAAIVIFSGGPVLAQPLTGDKAALIEAIESVETIWEGTALYDATYFALQQLAGVPGVKAVVALADGDDNRSSRTNTEVIDYALALGIPIYTICLGSDIYPERLEEMAQLTGGLYFRTPDAAELEGLYLHISEMIRAQYVIRYTTHNPKQTGEVRTVTITAEVAGEIGSDQMSYRLAEDLEWDEPVEFEAGHVTWAWRLTVPENTENIFLLVQKITTTGEGWQPRGYGQYGWDGTLNVLREGGVVAADVGYRDFAVHLRDPAPGLYTVEVTSVTPGAAILTARTALPELVLGEWATGTILRSWGSAWYQVEVPRGVSRLYFSVETLGVWSPLDVYEDQLRGPERSSKAGHRIDLEIPFPSSGTYYIEFADSAIIRDSRGQPIEDQQRDFLIRADSEPIEEPPPTAPIITKLSTYIGGAAGPVTVTITGAGLDPEATVSLVRANQPSITAHRVVGADDRRALAATFDLSTAPPGEWTVRVTNPDRQHADAPTSFVVEVGGEAQLWVEVIGREVVRLGRPTTYHIRFGNGGAVDAYDLLLQVRLPQAATVTMDLPALQADGSPLPSFSLGAPEGTDQLINVWVVELPAGSTSSFELVVNASSGQAGGALSIEASLAKAPESAFSLTGDYALIDSSPIFAALVDAIEEALDKHGAPLRGKMYHRAQGWRDQIRDRLRDWAAGWSFGMSFVPKYALIGAGAGYVLGNLPGAVVGVTLGAAIDTAVFAFNFATAYMNFAIRQLDALDVTLVNATTPEDKYGPSGHDPPQTAADCRKRFVPLGRPPLYRIEFWNKEDATAPAQDVFVEDQLDGDLDWTTFEFIGFGFLKWKVELDGGQYFNVDVDLRPDMYLIVNVEGTFDPETGWIKWTFHSMDPWTCDYPLDPMGGFLLPITESGYEIGWVDFTVRPKADLGTGSEITNQAFVNFDGVGPFNPAPKEGPWLNTIDVGAPESSVAALDDVQTTVEFAVSWSGQDDKAGSGIRNYTIYVSKDDEPYTVWLANATETSATFTGEDGRSYRFYSRATDNVGHVEPEPSDPDATTTVVAEALAERGLPPLCGAGLCGQGMLGAVPVTLLGLCGMKLGMARRGRLWSILG